MAERQIVLDAHAVHRVLNRIAHEIAERNDHGQNVVIVGVQRGGVHLADRLAQLTSAIWGHSVAVGRIDVNLHRDDLNDHAAPRLLPTVMPFDVTGKTVVLVDDVLFSGRTIRAALDALNDFGRPRRVQLAVLVDRGHRDLPIKADFVGKNVPTALDERINVQLKEDGTGDMVSLEKV